MAENNIRNQRWSQSGFTNRGDSGRQRETQNTKNRNEHRGAGHSNEQRAEQPPTNRSRPIMPDYVRPLRNAASSTHQPTLSRQSAPLHQPQSSHQFPQPYQTQSPHQSPLPHQTQSPHQSPPQRQSPPPSRTAKSGLGGFLDKLNLKNFDLDADRALIIMMMALLQKETFDETLMLALLYIML